MAQTSKPEPFLMAKELSAEAAERGLKIGYEYVRRILKLMPPMVAPRHRWARWSDFYQWYCLHPDVMPFSRDPAKRGGGEAGGTRSLGEVAS